MKQTISIAIFLFAIGFSSLANDLDALQGRWTLKKSGDNGPITQTLEFKKGKWTFKLDVEGGDGGFITGDAEVKKAGAFDTIRFHLTKMGPSETDLRDADEERDMVFSIQDGKLYIATNLDRQRENEKPVIDVYSKAVEAAKGSNELVGSWKLDLELNDNKYDYTLRIAEDGGKLNAVIVSPRSGEHKVKTVTFDNGVFNMEVDREIENTPVTFVYTGKLEGKTLSGKTTVKGAGDDLSGTWSARK